MIQASCNGSLSIGAQAQRADDVIMFHGRWEHIGSCIGCISIGRRPDVDKGDAARIQTNNHLE